ncbi:MAG TPA: hypothetical protein VFY71_18470 [Planctomycetota bacterium]|nr:hypothetical protein [Planctomycetota bacterium]
MADSATLECPGCGYVLARPPELGDNAWCSCGHCRLILRNDAAARAFRWELVDPYVRRNGASRANLWGGLLGAIAWLPALMICMALAGKFDVLLLVALAAPYLVLLAWLRMRRARTPMLVWMMEVWAGLGAYMLYLAGLHIVLPESSRVVFSFGGVGPAAPTTLGILWLLVGLIGRAWYRRRAERLPQLYGQPPAV